MNSGHYSFSSVGSMVQANLRALSMMPTLLSSFLVGVGSRNQ